MKRNFVKLILMTASAMFMFPAMAQDSPELSMGTDIVSRYIWRGQKLGDVSLQPTLGVSYKGLSLTAWGSVGLSEPKDTKEFDLTLAYTVGGFNVGITDYWFDSAGDKYFVYGAHSTAHTFEANIGYDFGVVHELCRQRRSYPPQPPCLFKLCGSFRTFQGCRLRLVGNCRLRALRHEFLFRGTESLCSNQSRTESHQGTCIVFQVRSVGFRECGGKSQ